MKLIDGWQNALRLWSVRFSLLAAFLAAAEVAYTLWASGTTPIISAGAAVMSLSAAFGRIVQQANIIDDNPSS